MNGIETSGTASLFDTLSRFSRGVTMATAPSAREMALRAENNRLSSENRTLEAENRLLESRKRALEEQNRRLEGEVARLENEITTTQQDARGESAGRLVDTFV